MRIFIISLFNKIYNVLSSVSNIKISTDMAKYIRVIFTLSGRHITSKETNIWSTTATHKNRCSLLEKQLQTELNFQGFQWKEEKYCNILVSLLLNIIHCVVVVKHYLNNEIHRFFFASNKSYTQNYIKNILPIKLVIVKKLVRDREKRIVVLKLAYQN